MYKIKNYYKISLLTSIIMLAFFITTVKANNISVFVDGEQLITEVPPQIINNSTMVPLRAISEAVGCRVDWFAEDKRIVVYTPVGGDPLLVMTLNDPNITVNTYNGYTGEIGGKVVTIDSPPTSIRGTTLVPLRFIAETIGFEVDWDAGSKTAFLISSGYKGDPDSKNARRDPGDTEELQWWGLFTDSYSGISIELYQFDGSSFQYVVYDDNDINILEGYGTLYPDNEYMADLGETSLLLYEDFSGINFFASESSEWAFLRGEYLRSEEW